MATEKKTAAKTTAKTETAAKTTKTATKKTETKAAAKAETKTTATKTAAKKTTTTKKTTTKKAAKVEMFIEFGGVQVSVDEIIKNVQKVNGKDAKKYTIYVKPEESKAYFVADGEEKDMDVYFA